MYVFQPKIVKWVNGASGRNAVTHVEKEANRENVPLHRKGHLVENAAQDIEDKKRHVTENMDVYNKV